MPSFYFPFILSFVLVRGVPSTPEATTCAVHRIGAMRRTMYSDGLWDTAPRTKATDDDDGDDGNSTDDKYAADTGSVENTSTSVDDGTGSSSCSSGDSSTSSLSSAEAGVVDTAYTNMELLPHTDCTYYRDPPALQVFNCVQVLGCLGVWVTKCMACISCKTSTSSLSFKAHVLYFSCSSIPQPLTILPSASPDVLLLPYDCICRPLLTPKGAPPGCWMASALRLS